ncbi:MAG: thiamine phosphate synthase [Acidobacteria bacterium]|nr:thiamine phosphate synthase [Acidobacteriota bacterium]
MAEQTGWINLAQGRTFPRLYAILDMNTIERRGLDLFEVARIWRDAGVEIVQYRDKISSSLVVVSNAARLRHIFSGSDTLFILNDSPAMARDAGVQAVHIGQTDSSIEIARKAVSYIGISTHNEREVIAADQSEALYVALGPVFGTPTKRDTAPVVGLEGIRHARQLTTKPLVAIGGITLANAPDVLAAGADSVAVISALLEGDLDRRAKEFLRTVSLPSAA